MSLLNLHLWGEGCTHMYMQQICTQRPEEDSGWVSCLHPTILGLQMDTWTQLAL